MLRQFVNRYRRARCKRAYDRESRRRRTAQLEVLEGRYTLDAAPYVVEFSSSGTFLASATNYGDPDITVVESRPFSGEFTRVPTATPGSPNVLLFEIEDGLSVNSGGQYSFTELYDVHAEQYDYSSTIGQPDEAYFEFGTNLGASADGNLYANELEVFGEAEASISYETRFVTRIWDTDCPHAGIPVTGDWGVFMGSRDEQPEADPPTSTFDESVTVRFWRAPEDGGDLVMESEVTYPVPVGEDYFAELNITDTFDLTTGSEIEVLATGSNQSMTNTLAAELSDTAETLYGHSRSYVAASVSNLRYHSVDVLDFKHRVLPSGEIDPQWLAVEYEVLRDNICYFDLQLGSQADYQSVPVAFEQFRISEDVLNNSARFLIANPETGQITPNSEAFELGRHVLLIDGNMPSLQGQLADLNTTLISAYEPNREEFGKEYHGFFQATPESSLVIRSDAATQDSILLDDFSATFDFGGEVSNFDFPMESEMPPVTSVPEVIVFTVGGDDDVLASPDFEVPINARLGDGNDIFVGGEGGDEARGGQGNDVLLGEGWLGDVTALETLLEDMVDLQFSFAAGLEPANGDNDFLFGESGDDFLLGGVGDDTLDSGSGAAVILGDSLSVDSSITFDAENLDFATDIDFTRSGVGMDTITAGDDHTLVIAGGGNDSVLGNTAGTSLLFGNAGDDTITGRNSFAVIAGGAGNDTIDGTGFLIGDSFSLSTFGSSIFDALKNGSLSAGVALTAEDSGDDVIQGGSGFDFIVGGDGNDEIDGGDGLNIVFGDSFNLSLSLGLNFAEIFSFESAFSIFSAPLTILNLFELEFEFAGTGSDIYNGGSDTDVAFGGGGDDTLYGNAGLDFLVGGDGHDTVDVGDDYFFSGEFGDVGLGGPGNDTITGSAGADYLESEQGNDTFFGLAGNDTIFGGADADVLNGGPGDDRLYGEGGDDEINGGDGDDEVFGGPGVDNLDGGAGNNTVNQDPVPPHVIAIGPKPGTVNPTNATTVQFAVVFDRNVSGIEPADFRVATTGSATGAVESASATSGQTVMVNVNGVGGLGRVALNFDADASGGVTDDLGSNSTQDFSGAYFVVGDLVRPNVTVDIVDVALDDSDRMSAVTFEFSEEVVDFDLTDITVHAGTLSDFMAIDGSTYTAVFTAVDAFGGVGSVTVQPSSYLDVAGNRGSMGTDSVDIDTLDRLAIEIESFDSVEVPGLPSGWTTTSTASNAWGTVSGGDSNSAPNHAFVVDVDETSDNRLISPVIPIPSNAYEFRFRNDYDTESTYDGGLLKISIDGGPFAEIISAGGEFVEGGYTDAVDGLGGNDGWTGTSEGYIDTVIRLPSNALGQNVQFQWVLGTDSSVGGVGWRIDDIQLVVIELPVSESFDFGDAPNSYLTLDASAGPKHILDANLFLGTVPPDADEDGFGDGVEDNPNTASDDDSEGAAPDDEDGVSSFAALVETDTTYSVTVSLTNLTGGNANLVGWIDFDGNGTFEVDEAASALVSDSDTSATLIWNNIGSTGADIISGDTFARFRLTTDAIDGNDPGGAAIDGEVEDYQVSIAETRQFVVNTTADTVDANVGDGLALDAFGNTSLRAAIEEANAMTNLAGGPDEIFFDIPGAGPHSILLSSVLPLINDPVLIDGTSEPDYVDQPIVIVDGSVLSGHANDGIIIRTDDASLRGLAVISFSGDGVELRFADNALLQSLHLEGNDGSGLRMVNSTNSTLTSSVITGNQVAGVQIAGTDLNQGNFITDSLIGILPDETPDGNSGFGIHIKSGGNTVSGNTVSGNGRSGLVLSGASASNNVVFGNRLGTDSAGLSGVPNGAYGILISEGTGNMIGGATPAMRNIISGNDRSGVVFSGGASNNTLAGNLIGLGGNGSITIGNGGNGVFLAAGAAANGITGNVISANSASQIALRNLATTGNTVSGNTIGLSEDLTTEIMGGATGLFIKSPGNTFDGNLIAGATSTAMHFSTGAAFGNTVLNNLIGTSQTDFSTNFGMPIGVRFSVGAHDNTLGPNNRIGHSTSDAVRIDNGGEGNRVTQNQMVGNVFGIDLGSNGSTANDAGDPDEGPNRLQNKATSLAVTVTDQGATQNVAFDFTVDTLAANATHPLTVEFFFSNASGEGIHYLDESVIAAPGTYSFNQNYPTFSFPFMPTHGTATVTDADGNTSEFSDAVLITYSGGGAGEPLMGLSATPPATYDPRDVNQDQRISAIDALMVINSLNSQADSPQGERIALDVNNDQHVSAADALEIINYLNHQSDPAGSVIDTVLSDEEELERLMEEIATSQLLF